VNSPKIAIVTTDLSKNWSANVSNTHEAEAKLEQLPEPGRKSQQAWRQLRTQIRRITPSGLARFGLVAAALLTIGWLIKVSWLALLPFVVGAIIAYILLPVVNWLDRWLPRILAVILTLAGALGALGFVLNLAVPALAEQILRVHLATPSAAELREYAEQARAYVQTLPESTQDTIQQVLNEAGTTVRENLDVYLANLSQHIFLVILSLVNTIGFILGFLIVPAWLLTVLNEQKKGRDSLNRLLPAGMRADFWAVVRIIDRTFRAFLQGQLLLGLVNGVGIYLGLSVLEWLGWPDFEYKLLAALFIGLMNLIPSVGPFLGTIPAFLRMVFQSFFVGASILVVYLVVQWLVNMLVVPRIERKTTDIHPAILIVVIVALSTLGFWWILLAAPVATIIRDLFRYAYGRVSDPPRPAGLLPGEALPAELEPALSAVEERRVPLVYRRGRALRQTES
jgi:predicted PurR-regulated permease PerM